MLTVVSGNGDQKARKKRCWVGGDEDKDDTHEREQNWAMKIATADNGQQCQG